MSIFAIIPHSITSNFPLTRCIKQVTEISKQDRPVLIIWAQYDITTPSNECFPQWHNLFKNNPKASFAVIKNVRHNFLNEEIELSNRLILAWIKGEDYKTMELHKLRNQNSHTVVLTERDQSLKKFWEDNKEYHNYMI